MLRRWWTGKYKLPWTPKYIEDLTELDLLVEFYEDLFTEDKTALFEASRNEDGEIVFESTGDPLIDKWEKELALGMEPDLTEGMTQEDLDLLKEEQSKSTRAKKQLHEVTSIDENFNNALRVDPRYANKKALDDGDRLVGKGPMTKVSPLDILGGK